MTVSLEPQPSVATVHPGTGLLDRVWELYCANARTLGFLPRGALEQFALAGQVIALVRGEELLGYAAWRCTRSEAALVHLCVAEPHRGGDSRDRLLVGVIERCRGHDAIRLRCRRDYEGANRLWPRHGFTHHGEVRGRGADEAALIVWRRVQVEQARPLLDAIRQATPAPTFLVALDANVFFDLVHPESAHHDESRVLLAEWLDDVELLVTHELPIEVSRQEDPARRRDVSSRLRPFRQVGAHPDALGATLQVIAAVLPEATTDSDFSDRRQLAHAWRGGAHYFATRDQVLLDHAHDLREITGLHVLRPSDVVAHIQGDDPNAYAPVRLQGTPILGREARSEAELLPFQRFAARESKAEWVTQIRAARCRPPGTCTVELFGSSHESPRVAVGVDRGEPGVLRLRFARALSGPLTGTILRGVLANIVESARREGRQRVEIDDPGLGTVREALVDLGFEPQGASGLVRYTLEGMVAAGEALALIRGRLPDAVVQDMPATDLETRYWPLKVLGAGIQTFLLPIRPHFAAALFERDLAGQLLFPVPVGPALSLENVYYSASNVTIPAGSRIVWYVSGKVGEVRAVSSSLGTDLDTATQLSRRYHRLGVYRWADILAAANGEPEGTLRAYTFSRTELLKRRVEWSTLAEQIHRHTGTRNSLASPVRVPESLFEELYRLGMGIQP